MPLTQIATRLPVAPPLLMKSAEDSARLLPQFYQAAFQAMGPQYWWPASPQGGPFEVIVGAILTQSTAWVNVEHAITNLRNARALSPRAIGRMPSRQLQRLVRPSGYFRQKARKLKAFVKFLDTRFGGSLEKMFRTPTAELREMLLAVHGIGPETADSILLYAAKHPVFVVDAYTRRILSRHGLLGERAKYEEMRALFENNLPRDTQMFNEFHALIVNIGKDWCRPSAPRCDTCPLGSFMEARA